MSPHESPRERLLFRWAFCVYFGLVLFALLVLWSRLATPELTSLGRYALTSVFLVGKFVVFLGLRESARFGPWELATLVLAIDLGFAFLLSAGMQRFEYAPLLGRWMRRSRRRARQVLEAYPGLTRMAFFGVAAFVMLPLAATGAISGAFAARLVGLSRLTGVTAIGVGAVGTAGSFALLATFLGRRAEELARSPALVGLSVLVVLVIGRLAYLRVTRELKRGGQSELPPAP